MSWKWIRTGAVKLTNDKKTYIKYWYQSNAFCEEQATIWVFFHSNNIKKYSGDSDSWTNHSFNDGSVLFNGSVSPVYKTSVNHLLLIWFQVQLARSEIRFQGLTAHWKWKLSVKYGLNISLFVRQTILWFYRSCSNPMSHTNYFYNICMIFYGAPVNIYWKKELYKEV